MREQVGEAFHLSEVVQIKERTNAEQTRDKREREGEEISQLRLLFKKKNQWNIENRRKKKKKKEAH